MFFLPAFFALILTGNPVGTAVTTPATLPSAITHFGVAQEKRPLSLAQIQQLIANRTPDEIIASEILERGVSFGIDRVVISALKAKGAGKKTLQTLLEKQRKSTAEPVIPEPEKIIVLVAEFTALDRQKHGVTETILDQLRDATKEYPEIEILYLEEPVNAQQGSDVARLKGKERGANIVLWGWYSSSKDKVLLSIHFELLESPASLALIADKETLVRPIAELEGFQIQMRLSSEMSYLTLLTLGLARLEGMDFDGAIARFTKALIQPSIPDTMVNRTDVLFFRGLASFMKNWLSLSTDGAKTIDDLNEVIRLEPDHAFAYLLRAGTYALMNNWDKTIQDCDKVIEIAPEISNAYMTRGLAYKQKQDNVRAAADFEKATRLIEASSSADPQDFMGFYNRGHAYLVKGDNERALIVLTRAVDLKPSEPILVMILLQRAIAFGELKRYDEAIADFSRAIRINDNYSLLYLARGGVFREKGEFDKAITDYSRAIKMSPNLAEAYHERGDSYWKKEEYQNAIADFDQVIRLKPNYSAAYYNRALAKRDKGDLDGALRDSNKFIELEPSDPDGFSQRALLHTLKRDFAPAILDYAQAIKLAPLIPRFYFLRATLEEINGNLDSALADYSQTIALKKDYENAHLYRAYLYLRLGKTNLALNDFAESLKLKPDDISVYMAIANLHGQLGNLTGAVDDYTASLKIKPDAGTYLVRGVCYQRLKKTNLAEADYSEALRLNPRLATGYLIRGDLYEQQDQLDLAVNDYSSYIGLKPEDATGYLRRAKVYRRASKFSKAIGDYDKAIGIRPGAETYLLRGFSKDNLGQLDSAVSDYSEAVRIKPTLADAYLFRGLAYARKGDRDRAVSDLKKVLEMTNDPELTEPAKKKLEQLGTK